MARRLLSANPPECATVGDYVACLTSDTQTLSVLVTNTPSIVPELVIRNTAWAVMVARQWLSEC